VNFWPVVFSENHVLSVKVNIKEEIIPENVG